MTDLAPLIGELIKRIESNFAGVISNETAWEFTALAAAAFLPEYVTVSWPNMKLGLFDPIDGIEADDPGTGYRLKQMTVADVKATVIGNAAYQR